MTGDGAIVADSSRFSSHPADIAVRRLKAILHVELASLRRSLLPFRDHNGGVGRMDRAGPSLAKAFFQRQPSDRLPARICVKTIACDVGLKDADGRKIAQRPKALFARLDLLVRGSELGRASADLRLNDCISLLQFCAIQGDAAHFAPALEDRHDQKDILEQNPGGVFYPTPRASCEHSKNRERPKNTAQEMVGRYND